MTRRAWMLRALGMVSGAGVAMGGGGPALAEDGPDDDAVLPGRTLRFPRDHGAHPGARIEWWYATGWLAEPGRATPAYGFQLTFFRSRTDAGDGLRGRFVPRQLLFAHAALTDLAAGRHRHAQRLQRWSGDETEAARHARRADTDVALGAWSLRREDTGANARPGGVAESTGQAGQAGPAGRYLARLPAPDAGFELTLTMDSTQPLLLQGVAGYSRKGPEVEHASHYTTQPQLATQAGLRLADGSVRALRGRAWLDHEWSNALLAPGAVGWDWIGINLDDGGALTAFVLRRADGSVLWAGGSHRPAGGVVRDFAPQDVAFAPGRTWTSPQTAARYPVAWQITTPIGRFGLQALLDAQELDGRGSTGTVYWEGLAELRRDGGDSGRAGLGYLEMTGRAGPLRLG